MGQNPPRVHNRIGAVMEHVNYYGFQGQVRLARDADVSKSAVSRLLSGQTTPSFAVTLAVVDALSQRLGKRLDVRELISLDGRYPTASACALCGCPGCLPRKAWNDDDTLRPEYRQMRSGEWSLAPPAE